MKKSSSSPAPSTPSPAALTERLHLLFEKCLDTLHHLKTLVRSGVPDVCTIADKIQLPDVDHLVRLVRNYKRAFEKKVTTISHEINAINQFLKDIAIRPTVPVPVVS